MVGCKDDDVTVTQTAAGSSTTPNSGGDVTSCTMITYSPSHDQHHVPRSAIPGTVLLSLEITSVLKYVMLYLNKLP